MSEVIQQGWEEPETIRQTMMWPVEVSRAVAEYAEKADSTPIDVITQFVREALQEQGYDFNGNGSQRSPITESGDASVSTESA